MDTPDMAGDPARGSRRRAATPGRVAVVGHEIRGPLGVMMAVSELLLARGIEAEERRLVELIRLAGAHALGVADDLVTEASLAARPLRICDAPFDPAEMAESLAALWMPMAAGAARRVTAILDDDLPPTVVSDEKRVRQVLFNLVSNATRHCARGTIEIAVSRCGDGIAFEVRDAGGQPPGNAGRTPGPRDPLAAPSDGAGIGLTISHRLAEALGGTLQLAVRPDGGTTARLELPAAPPARGAGASKRKRSRPSAKRPTRGKGAAAEPSRTARAAAGADVVPATRRPSAEWPLARMDALVVDDSAVSRMLMTAMLSSFGMTVSTVAGGGDAETFAIARRPDIVLVDWSLAGETGADVVERLQAALGADMPPVVIVSAEWRTPAVAGVVAQVRKPFSPGELFRTLVAATGAAQTATSAG